MDAHPGDQLVIRGTHVGQHNRKGTVLDARGPGDTEPFVVRWDDNGHTTLFFPGSDCMVEPVPLSASGTKASS